MRLASLVGVVFVASAGAGCGTPTTAEVAGEVTVDGRPVDAGSVTFVPTDPNGRQFHAIVENGAYKVTHKRVPPALPGKYKVEVRWAKPTGKKVMTDGGEQDDRKEGLPAKYHAASELTADLGPGPRATQRLNLGRGAF